MANEKRLIDANALMDKVDKSKYDNPHTIARVRLNHHQEHDHFYKMIYDAPTVDAVEVVRCKDCKHWNCWRNSGEGSGDCCLDEGYATLATQHYDFCSYGERREGE